MNLREPPHTECDVFLSIFAKKKQIWRKVETRSEGKTLLREIENDLANGTESFENRDSLDSYLDKWLSMTKGTWTRSEKCHLRRKSNSSEPSKKKRLCTWVPRDIPRSMSA